jgi:PAS domain-containing protein
VETRWQRKDGSMLSVMLSSTPLDIANLEQGVTFTALDITARKEAEEQILRNQARLYSIVKIVKNQAITIDDLLEQALEEAVQLTGSQFGYIFQYDEPKKRLTLNTWSNGALAASRIEHWDKVYELDKTGLWGDAVHQRIPVFDNNYQEPGPSKGGDPMGSVPLQRFLSVPVSQAKQS